LLKTVNPDLDDNDTVIEAAFNSSNELVSTIREYEDAVEKQDAEALEVAMDKMNHLNAWDFELRIKQILTQLKITNFNQKTGELSGGQKKRVALANVLINTPDLLIMDEPTNHLDLDMIEWLEKYLEKTRCTLFMVTHDRYFLDRVCNEILEMDDDVIYRYRGNYSYFLEKREERIEQQVAEVDKAKNLLRTELEWLRRMPKARGTKSKYRIENAHKLKEKASQRRDDSEVELNVKAARLGKKILEVDNLSKSFGDLHLFEDFSYNFARFEKVGIVGENGTGKSTFLNIITGALSPDTGSIDVGETIKYGYYRQDGITFNPGDKVLDVVTEIAEVIDLGNGQKMTASQFLQMFLFPPEVQHSFVEKLSGGERRRLYLCTVLIQNPNFLILDEPTNDLDIMTLNVLEDYLRNFSGCVIIVSHDRYFMDKVVDHLFVFSEDKHIKDFPGNYSIYRDWKEEQEQEKRKLEKKDKPVVQKQEKSGPRKMTYKEKREFEQLEKDISELEEEKSVLEEQMNSGGLGADDLVEKSKRYSEIKEMLDEKEFRWLELSEIGDV
jgi:ATP-binding cassette subfamily F protein uup